MTLPNDHTQGVSPGSPTPETMFAVNDEATGMLVDGISHGPLWKRSLVVIVEVLARMEAKLDAAGLDAGASVADVPGRLVATPTGTMFHRPDCPVVADRPAGELRTITLPATGMSPCKLCAPLG